MKRQLGLLCVVSALPLLAGCTGEETTDLTTLLTLPNGGRSYLPYVVGDGKLTRWAKTTISVYIDTENVPRGWRPEYEGYAIDALLQWQNAAEGAFTFARADGPADINMSWVSAIPGPGAIGGNTSWTTGWNTFSPMEITIAIGGFSEVQIYASTLHEIGHALGMDGHSPNFEDAMAPGSYTLELSPNDVATLLDMYSRTPQIREES